MGSNQAAGDEHGQHHDDGEKPAPIVTPATAGARIRPSRRGRRRRRAVVDAVMAHALAFRFRFRTAALACVPFLAGFFFAAFFTALAKVILLSVIEPNRLDPHSIPTCALTAR